jgi:hypothetical protein
MPNHFNDGSGGPIRGLHLCLPFTVWCSLRDEGVTTIDELRAVADRLERLPGIGTKTAQVIREELARASSPEEDPSGPN